MVKLFIISLFLTAATSFLLGFIIFFKNRKSKINILWFLTSVCIFIWSGALGLELSSSNYLSAFFWNKILTIGAIFTPILFYNFISSFLEEKRERKFIFSGYLAAFFLIFFLFFYTSLFIEGVSPRAGFNYWVDPGIIYYLFVLFFIICILRTACLLFKKYKDSDDVKKSQIKYLLFAIIVGFGGGITNFLPQLVGIYPFGSYFVILYVIFISYAVLKHHLFDIRVIATELLTFSLWIFVLIRTLLSETSKEWIINGSLLAFVVVSGILLIRSVLKEVKTREEMEALAWKLEQANIKLKELDKAKSDFVTITSHQLRTPITAIKGYASMVLEGSFGKIPEKASMAIDRIFQSSNRLVALINDFLNLSRIERGKMEYAFAKVNLKEMIETIFDEFKTINAKKKTPLNLSLKIEEKDDIIANADSDKIRQTIYNLIDNAIKYTPKGFVKVSLFKDASKDEIIMKVEDSGKGMSKDTLDNIFEKFARAKDDSEKFQVEGTGLGLYVAREIAKAHGGDVWAESAGLEKGSAFYMKLPANFVSPQEKERQTEIIKQFVKEI